jgi:hypothetical protein
MRSLVALLIASMCVAVAVAAPTSTAAASTAAAGVSSCSGPVHAKAIALWEHGLRDYYAKQITDGLGTEGNVYVLYNTQEELQSFVEMTRRCKDRAQIAELVSALAPVFDSLRPLPDAPAARGWVCTGGSTCTPANHLLGHEVQLCSAQFLGLIGALATDIVETVPENQRSGAEKAFVSNTGSAIASQVDRWLSPDYFKGITERSRLTPASVTDSQSKYFFQDRDLWFLTSLSDLAELHQAGVKLDAAGTSALKSLQAKRGQIAEMFNLFLARTTLVNTQNGPRAEIDRGYWRNYADSKYALYSAATSPVQCSKNMFGKMQKSTRVQSNSAYIDNNIGWDFSHARRLVPALDTFVRNKAAVAAVFGYNNPAFAPTDLRQAYARQVANTIWNKDTQYPLFSNSWDGSNGWYRAGYDNGTGACQPGQPPYSLAWSFPTGGYPQWGGVNGTIRQLNATLYGLFESTDPAATAFVKKYYSTFAKQEPPTSAQQIWSLSFLASITGL